MKKTEVYIVGGILAGLLLVGGVMHLRRGISETIEIPETAPHAEETSIPKKEGIDDPDEADFLVRDPAIKRQRLFKQNQKQRQK